MRNPTLLHTLRIELRDAAVWLSRKLSILLEREIICEATADDYDYWTLRCTNDRFSLADLCKLLSYVNASKEMVEWTIPSDSDSTRGIDVKLCNALLQDILHTGWEEQLVQDDAVYLIGVSQETLSFPPSFPGILQIGTLRIRAELLLGKNELLEALGKDGNNYSALANLSGRNLDLFGNELYWHYPISDDLHTGVYFVLVREGVLCLPYLAVDCDVNEQFEINAAHLCTAEEMQNYLDDWSGYSNYLSSTMQSLRENIILKELENEKA